MKFRIEFRINWSLFARYIMDFGPGKINGSLNGPKDESDLKCEKQYWSFDAKKIHFTFGIKSNREGESERERDKTNTQFELQKWASE